MGQTLSPSGPRYSKHSQIVNFDDDKFIECSAFFFNLGPSGPLLDVFSIDN